MGALHDGHLSLIRASVAECDQTVISIYVNPAQFGPGEDLAQYPRRLEEDCRLAEENGVDLAFCPTDEVMYGSDHATYLAQEGLTDVLEGAFRPVHFRGVLTVVCKLFNIAPADRAYFGRKDFQQSVVIRRMVRDLKVPIAIRVMPTVREPDGLAMSSRNGYLDEDQRAQALCLHRALSQGLRLYAGGETDAEAIREAMRGIIAQASLARPDYIEVVDGETLAPVAQVTDGAVAVLATRFGSVRLIDNMPFGAETG
jgi:pantoate--beta-alanine ligase